MTNLFNIMGELVDKHVKYYKEDFEIDKKIILKNKDSQKYYWFLRETGTEIFNADELKEKQAKVHRERAEFWLDKTRHIYELNIDKIGKKYAYGYLKPINKNAFEKMLKDLIYEYDFN